MLACFMYVYVNDLILGMKTMLLCALLGKKGPVVLWCVIQAKVSSLFFLYNQTKYSFILKLGKRQ